MNKDYLWPEGVLVIVYLILLLMGFKAYMKQVEINNALDRIEEQRLWEVPANFMLDNRRY